ncbi:hypothetical protein JK358_35570 [Nocardia sp. 2]|uniref:Uncharacterized protein n=1 Tax=Nocardia acididurans TaxID=2802282 RepID=A0ABS1MJ81_9NOCA|nr:hypothetical protein [Nocardia acididurans]MBL1079734.1 hypothetical protein [Nocardia acididurans]
MADEPPPHPLSAATDAARAAYWRLEAINEAENVVADAHEADLLARTAAVRAELDAARARLAAAERGTDPAELAAAQYAEDAALTTYLRVLDGAISEHLALFTAHSQRLDELLDADEQATTARRAELDTLTGRDPDDEDHDR